eukprot:1613160-Amphidinium_carterae.1
MHAFHCVVCHLQECVIIHNGAAFCPVRPPCNRRTCRFAMSQPHVHVVLHAECMPLCIAFEKGLCCGAATDRVEMPCGP